MRDTAWLIVTKRGITRLAKGEVMARENGGVARRARPALKVGEYAVAIQVHVPDEVFAPAPLPTARLEVKPENVVAPPVVVEQLPPPDPLLVYGDEALRPGVLP